MVFAAGGVGFAAGNLLLARVLAEDEYARVALFLALTQLGIVLGPVGVETVINRHRIGASGRLLGRVGLSSAVVGLLLAAVAYIFYGFGAPLAVVLAATVLAGAVNRVAGAFFQSRRKFGLSLFLILIHNWIVLLAVPVVLLFDRPEALPAALTMACGYFAMALLGWWKGVEARHVTHSKSPVAPPSTLMNEGLAAVGVQLAVAALFQLDRLLIPNALSIRDLATYSVVSSIAASPFRMLQTGIPFALLPRLRVCETRAAIGRLLRHEIAIASVVSAVAALAVLLFTPWLLGMLLKSRYAFPMSLLDALVIVGLVRVWGGISGAVVAALGSGRQLALFNLFGWIALGVAVVCAFAASGAGLTGVVYGIGAGWLALALAGTAIGARAVGSRAVSGMPR
jgi:O-antigen/teichoic acid export membrane protein